MKTVSLTLTLAEAIYIRQLLDAEDSLEDESRHMPDAHYPGVDEPREDALRKLAKVAP